MNGSVYKKILLFFLLIYSGIALKAQSDFRSGYIITNSNDTIKGFINFHGEVLNSNICKFVKSLGDNPTIYKPGDIFGYRFADGKYYVTYTIKINGDSKTVFLEFLLNGIVDLYCYKDINGDHFYIDDKNNNLVELTNDDLISTKWEYTRTGTSKSQFVTKSNKYIGVLNYLFSDQSSLQNKIKEVKLNRPSLITIARDYHNLSCKGNDCIVYEMPVAKVKYRFSPIISFSNSKLSLSQVGSKIENSRNVSAGLLISMWFRGLNEKYSIDYEFDFSMRHYKSTSKTLSSTGVTKIYDDYNIDQNSLNNTLSVKYMFPERIIRPMLYLGISTGYYFKSNVKDLREEESVGIVRTSVSYFQSDKIYYGCVFGIGLQSMIYEKPIFIRLQYNPLMTIDTFNLINHGNNVSLKIGVIINR